MKGREQARAPVTASEPLDAAAAFEYSFSGW